VQGGRVTRVTRVTTTVTTTLTKMVTAMLDGTTHVGHPSTPIEHLYVARSVARR
jgi:hypothetical protein